MITMVVYYFSESKMQTRLGKKDQKQCAFASSCPNIWDMFPFTVPCYKCMKESIATWKTENTRKQFFPAVSTLIWFFNTFIGVQMSGITWDQSEIHWGILLGAFGQSVVYCCILLICKLIIQQHFKQGQSFSVSLLRQKEPGYCSTVFI